MQWDRRGARIPCLTTAADIAHAAGFGSQSSFYEHFTRICGTSPRAYRQSLR